MSLPEAGVELISSPPVPGRDRRLCAWTPDCASGKRLQMPGGPWNHVALRHREGVGRSVFLYLESAR